jgi:ADP-ribose pyrophosphatase YjhB (NUDIX family)
MSREAGQPLLGWSRRLAAIAQSGLAFEPGVYDRQRYEQLLAMAAEMATWPGGSPEGIAEAFREDVGYATPKLVCRAAVFDDRDRILMVRETIDGLWTLPGGWIDVGDGPTASVEREVREETGYEVRVTKFAALFDKNQHPHPPVAHHSYILCCVCEVVGGSPRPSVETSEVEWFEEGDLPPLSEYRMTAGQIARLFEHHRQLDLATDLD